MLRSTFLYLSRQQRIFKFVRRNSLARAFARRFVAGETSGDAIVAAAELNRKGITASLDMLGEAVHNEKEARAAGREYAELLAAIADADVDANVSLKLTQMGLDVSDDLCVDVVSQILEIARKHHTFVRLDMESSAYAQRTMDLFEKRLYPMYGNTVGIVLQSMMRRTRQDVAKAIELQARVRLCKGAYLEAATVAFPDKKDVDMNYAECAKELMQLGNYAGLATHDEKLINELIAFAKEKQIAPERFEFQMLYGVRRDLQEKIVREGWRMRVYVPFGTQWYPYLMRRLAERPANVMFMTGSVAREMFGRSN